ncbi:MAG: ACT domain-containing protein [Ruminococcaceae bacterium]|nr:ACT domain-containing protein [Oscillospiraceae bacterium]
MKAVITVVGKDMVGILAKVSGKCAEYNANVIEVTQSVLQDMFAMVMLVDISKLSVDMADFADVLAKEGQAMGLSIHAMHEDIFNSMHRI